ncbi:MAG TPA: hypothetical protein VL309_04805 [Vicinamibacterales bacterium]|jgi:hypothetical protein|nr:hypothetical protein [Vicinamibacterales bacterium]
MPGEVRETGRLVCLLALAVYLATTGGSMATDIMSYEVTRDIVEHGTVAMSYNVFHMEAHRGKDGRYYAPYGIGHAVYSIPFFAAAKLVEKATHAALGKPEMLTKAGFVAGSAVAAALTVWVAFLFAWRLSGDLRAAVQTALAIAFGTLLWPYAKFGFNAPLGTLCVLVATYGVWVGVRTDRPRMLALGGAGIGAALLVKHELALVSIPIALWVVAESRGDWRLILRRGLVMSPLVVAAVLITLYYNDVRFGNPLDTGYLRDHTLGIGSFHVGLAGLLFSPGRSIFLYSPIALGGLAAMILLRRRDPSTMLLFAGEFAILLCFYASLVNWDAERSYGPRYMLPAMPLLVLPIAGVISRSRALAVLVALSVAVQVPGVLVDFSKVGAARVIGPHTEADRQWTWGASCLVINTRASIAAVPDNARRLATGRRPPVKHGTAGTRDFSDQFEFSLDFWWLYLYYLRVVSAPVALLLGAVSFGAAAVFAGQLRFER